MTQLVSTLFPVAEWVTTDQAVVEAPAICERLGVAAKLDGHDLRRMCRERYAEQGLAVYVGKEGILTGPVDYPGPGGRGVWLIHRRAVEQRLTERARGRGNPNFREKGQPGVHPNRTVVG